MMLFKILRYGWLPNRLSDDQLVLGWYRPEFADQLYQREHLFFLSARVQKCSESHAEGPGTISLTLWILENIEDLKMAI